MKITKLNTFFAAAALVAGLSACHSRANDNTSRPCVNDEHGRNVGNDEITENFVPGSDCNPNNDMWDGISGNLNKSGEAESHTEGQEEHK